MFAVFVIMPDTIPDAEPTLAMAGALLDHVPPATASLNVVVRPEHTDVIPVIAAGNTFTVTVRIAMQPSPSVYDMVAVPAVIPETIPFPAPISAVKGSLVLHTPPAIASVNVVIKPSHTDATPKMLDGDWFTVIVAEILQPVLNA